MHNKGARSQAKERRIKRQPGAREHYSPTLILRCYPRRRRIAIYQRRFWGHMQHQVALEGIKMHKCPLATIFEDVSQTL